MGQANIEILLECLSYTDHAGKSERLSQISAEAWQAVAALAQQHGVAPLLHHRLKQRKIGLPANVESELNQAYLKNLTRNMLLYHELGKLLRKFKEENIPVIVLKGAYLAEAVYDNIGLRVMGDIDLMVPYEAIPQAIDLGKSLGYIPERPFWPEVDGELHYHAPPITKKITTVELHWTLTRQSHSIQINLDDLWRRAQPFVVQENEVLALCPTDLFLHLAVHAAYGHKFHYQLRSIADLAELFIKFGDRLDWPQITQDCLSWHAEKAVYLILRLAHDLLGAAIPNQSLDALKPFDWDEKVLDWAKTGIYRGAPALSENYIRVMHSSSTGEKLAAFFKGLFPSREVMAMLYGVHPHSARIWLRYPRHAATRIWKYRGYAWNLARGDESQSLESISDQSLRDWLELP